VADITQLVRIVRTHPGLLAKHALRHVAETVGGDGDDAAVLPAIPSNLVSAAEAILPALVRSDPRVAGIAGVVTVLNDIAATGGRPRALLNTVVGPDQVVREALEGIAAAAHLYGVPVVGGHTTVTTGDTALSTFAVGEAVRPLRASNARPGDHVMLLTCLDGEMVHGPDGSVFFSHLRGPRRASAAHDLAILAEIAEAGEAWAARDVSMPGLIGSLIQFAESAGRLGVTVDIGAVPAPAGGAFEEWIAAFPSFGFLVVGEPDALARRATDTGLTCAVIGRFDDSGRIVLRSGAQTELAWDLTRDALAALDGGSVS
jgi:selenophosphate synthetase-related protein